jgi:hypothetical protein
MEGIELLGESAQHGALRRWMTWLDVGELPSDDVLEAYFVEEIQLVKARGFFAARVPELRDARIVGVEDHGPITTAVLDVARTGRWRVSAVFAPDGRVKSVMPYRDPPDVSVRDARPDDGVALAELCREVAIETPGRRVWFDYGEDYMAATALCADREVVIAEQDGRIVGLHGGAYHAAVLDDRSLEACYIRHTRIDARAQRSGVFSSLNGRLFERIRLKSDFNYSIVAIGNDRMLDKIPAEWRSSRPHRRFSVVCRDVARPHAEGEHIPGIDEAVTLLNDAHRFETMFHPHTASSLEDRLTTVPDYTSSQLLAAGSAVVGVRDHAVHVTVEDERGRRTVCQATASMRAADPMAAPTSPRSLGRGALGWPTRGSRSSRSLRPRAPLPARRSPTSARASTTPSTSRRTVPRAKTQRRCTSTKRSYEAGQRCDDECRKRPHATDRRVGEQDDAGARCEDRDTRDCPVDEKRRDWSCHATTVEAMRELHNC